jgi:hypothetical protein
MRDKYLDQIKKSCANLFEMAAAYEMIVGSDILKADANVVDALKNKIQIYREGRENALEHLRRIKTLEMFLK